MTDFSTHSLLSHVTLGANLPTLLIVACVLIISILLWIVVSQRLAGTHALRKSEARLRQTLNEMPLCYIEWDKDKKVTHWNPAAERTFGYKAEEVIGKTLTPQIVPPSVVEHVQQIWINLFRDTGGTKSTNENITKDGNIILCEWHNTPLKDCDGNVVGAFSLVQDVTERAHIEQDLQHAERLNTVGQLAAGVAHDFNNVLTIITGNVGLLLGKEDISKEVKQDLRQIELAALRAATLTRQLLAFSRQQPLLPRPLYLDEVLESSAVMLGRALGEDISFSVQLGDDPLAVEADPVMLDQLITNLVLNARDAMPDGGSIALSLTSTDLPLDIARRNADARPGPTACLVVADTGTGISRENIPKIFEPFFTTKPIGKGTGLGLSVVHGIVKQHHGWIDVQSELGKGTTFRIYLPLTTKKPTEVLEPNSAAIHATSDETKVDQKTILLVEDDLTVRNLARAILERWNYRVIEAVDGMAAFGIWKKHSDQIDLLLTDMVMPNGMSGRELSLRILTERPRLPVIYMTGYSMESTVPSLRENEKRILLQKPYLAEELLQAVRSCFESDAENK
jgi:two-component system, cell cycle sensor histidine kinase and response regulator CckA